MPFQPFHFLHLGRPLLFQIVRDRTAEARIGDIKTKALADVGAIAEEAASAVVEALIGQQPASDEVKAAVAAVATK